MNGAAYSYCAIVLTLFVIFVMWLAVTRQVKR